MKFRFFTHYSWEGGCPILATNEELGMFFFKNGKPYYSQLSDSYSLKNLRYINAEQVKEYVELGLQQAINKLSPEGKKYFLDFLKIYDLEKPPTHEEQNDVISILKKNRAFNADSALKPDNINCCLYLVEKNIIKQCDFKFFVDKDTEILTQSSLPL